MKGNWLSRNCACADPGSGRACDPETQKKEGKNDIFAATLQERGFCIPCPLLHSPARPKSNPHRIRFAHMLLFLFTFLGNSWAFPNACASGRRPSCSGGEIFFNVFINSLHTLYSTNLQSGKYYRVGNYIVWNLSVLIIYAKIQSLREYWLQFLVSELQPVTCCMMSHSMKIFFLSNCILLGSRKVLNVGHQWIQSWVIHMLSVLLELVWQISSDLVAPQNRLVGLLSRWTHSTVSHEWNIKLLLRKVSTQI